MNPSLPNSPEANASGEGPHGPKQALLFTPKEAPSLYEAQAPSADEDAYRALVAQCMRDWPHPGPFTVERAIVHAGLVIPDTCRLNAVKGPGVAMALRLGWIKRLGSTKGSAPQTHGGIIGVWEKANE